MPYRYRKYNPVEKVINRLFNKKSMISDELLEDKIRSFSRVSTSYFMLLTASIIIATLGLLMNASAIVIGSMIISPLTWPMFGLADGAALGNRKRIWANLAILVVSIILGALLAYVLTVLSPIKVINEEILSRSRPTLLDAVVALTAGGIGTLAIVRKNISDSVAGVAVALSLTPPLCVLGISLALGETEIVKGSFLLLLTNALSITLVAGVLFILIHYSWRRKLRMAPKAFAVMAISLALTGVPLYQLLNDYSLETSSYGVVQERLEQFVSQTSANSSVQNISTSLEDNGSEDVLRIEADIFLPPNSVITFQDRDSLIKDLETRLGRVVDLQLKLQNITLLANAEDVQARSTHTKIETNLQAGLAAIDQSIKLTSTQIEKLDDTWQINAQLTGYQDSLPNETELKEIEDQIAAAIGSQASLSATFLPLVQIQTNQQNNIDTLRGQLSDILTRAIPNARITSLNAKQDQGVETVVLEVSLPEGAEITEFLAEQLKSTSSQSLGADVSMTLQTTSFVETSL